MRAGYRGADRQRGRFCHRGHRGLAEVVAASDETRKAMGMRGRALVKRQFAWRAIAKNMRAIYESIVEQSRVMGKA